MLIKKGMLPSKFSVKVEWNIPVDLKHHKGYKAFKIILLSSTTRLKVSHCLLTDLGVKTCSNNYTWCFPCRNICTLITRKNSETVRQAEIGCYMQIQYTEHVHNGRQTKLTEKNCFARWKRVLTCHKHLFSSQELWGLNHVDQGSNLFCHGCSLLLTEGTRSRHSVVKNKPNIAG